MGQVANTEPERLYVDSLQWRRADLQAKLEDIAVRMASLAREEAELRQQSRAVEQLLAAQNASVDDSRLRNQLASGTTDVGPSAGGSVNGATADSLNFSAFGPKARDIYTSVAQVIQEAGVPLHYRVLAGEVQKKVPLNGTDPGATLIAHLHRAQDLFPRVGRGIYAVRGMVTDTVAPVAPAPAERPRKTRRRTL